jgi:hypothetical protein
MAVHHLITELKEELGAKGKGKQAETTTTGSNSIRGGGGMSTS